MSIIIEQNGIRYLINAGNHIAKIVASENAKGDIFIPRSINHKCINYEINEISKDSFKNSQIKSLTFAEDSNIISIPKNSFAFSTIEKLHISKNILKLENGWCCQTPNLKSITVSPENAYFQIYNNQFLVDRNHETVYFAFRNIESTTIPPEIKVINPYSFEFCQKIKSVIFTKDSKLKTICKFSFSNSTIESIMIPKSVTEIEHEAFYNCTHIKSFELDNNLWIKSNSNSTIEMKNSSKCLDFLIHCKSMINQIENDAIQKMYSKFTFKYFSFNNQEDNEEDFIIKLFEYLKKFKFIVCNLYNLSKGSFGINVDFSVSPKTNCIFCVEDEIFIIEQINTELINKQINNQQINLINLSQKNTELEIRYDVRFFCAKYFQAIKKNYFVKYTIQSIVCYLIRRNYYPSHYFKDSSFFEFEQTKNDFDENEFITLRKIYSNNDNSYFLIIHIETFHLFVMKKYNESTKKHEEHFCTNYSHPNFIRFYGFLKKNEKRIGLIYEFMSNGSFCSYIKNNKNDDMYLMFTIIRISNGIEYLHKNGLIHRDLKLSNILVDHNGIPYISDFETIRSTNISEGEFTYNFSSKYSSPEQDTGGLISFATDIFSFGRMIFILYENDYTLTLNNKDRISPMTKGPEIAHYLYESCVQYKQEDRIKIEEINFILMKNYLSFYSLFEQYLINGLEEDYSKGKDFYDKSVNLNNSEVFLNLGNLNFNGDGVEQDYLKAKEYYEKSANLGNSDAIIQIGKLYLNGYGVKKDYLKAKDYYEKAANLKNPSALSNLGILYECGYGVEQDYMKAKELYEKAANLNNSNGINNLGYLYENGYGVKQDYVKAKEYYEKAAKLDNPNALNNLGNLYRFGLEVEQNFLTAKEYFEKAVKLNNTTAMNNLGDLYFEGDGVEQDYSMAKKYYEKAANLNDSNGINNLGILYEYGYGVKQDYLKAKEYYEKAADLNDSTALNNLGDLYYNGYGVQQDYLRAKYYYEKAANLNYSDAFIMLGDIYYYGYGVEQDYLKSKDFYEKSSDSDNAEGLVKLGDLYYHGYGVKQDYLKAKDYYEKAANFNYTNAFNKLGDIYYYGYGVEQNYLKSRDFYAKSSDSNDSYAHFCLGDLYSNNEKFEVDFQKAINYFMKSINIQRGEQIVSYTRADNITQISFNPNNYRYISYNDLGLIYLIELKERNDANKYLKESFYAEYPFGQNNFGLYNQFYMMDQNNHENVKHMFERSSQHKFSLAEFNLGILYENENDIEKSMEYFIRASEHENEPLIYRDIKRVDKRLEISKLFIICLVDFKLIEYYFLQNNFDESKKYFIKLINRLKFNSKDSIYPFKFKIQCENENKEKLLNNLFSYLKRFIFNFPLFNLINQPNLDLNKYSDIFCQNDENEFQDETTDDKNAESTINTNDEKNENIEYLKEKTNDFDKQNDSYLMKKSSIIVDYLNKQSKDENIMKMDKKNVNIFTDPSEIFDFIVEETNPKIVTIFINEIKIIIKDMKEILYTPPYPILFGRIHIAKKNPKAKLENRNEKRKSIGKSFYDGFDLELDD